ncbi:MAG: tRNA (guanosine(46)-N7)-methyltransferase TrmB [Anaerolineae bacterium]
MPVFELDPKSLPWPVNWSEIYGRTAPLLIEIGFGGADFLVELARTRPNANILGVEISAPSMRKAAKKLNNAGVGNGRALQANARLLLQALCAPQSVSEIHINFPDPWPKDKHHGRRLISDNFLLLAASRLVPGGKLHIATDHAGYAHWIQEHLSRTPFFHSQTAVPFLTEDDDRLRTKYELIALNEGRTCHYFKYARNQTPAPDKFPVPQELPMPHVVLQSPLTLRQIGERFQPDTAVSGDTHVKLLEMFQSLYDDKLLVEAYINEQPLRQRVGLAIRQRETGDLVIGLHEVGFPRPTPGVQLAIAHLAQWVASLHPDTAVLKTNIPEKLEKKARARNPLTSRSRSN